MSRPTFASACSTIVVLGAVTLAFSQTSSPGLPGASPGSSPGSSSSSASTDAEREQIWNSPTMLRARAWVQEYCKASAKITPAEAKQYMTELEHLSPVQMKLWLLKFDHEEAMMRQQQAAFNMQRQAQVGQATAYEGAENQALADVNRDENEAAGNAEQSLQQQQEFSQERGLQNTADRDAYERASLAPLGYGPYGPFGGYPYGGYAPWGGGGGDVHIHVHPR